MELVLGGRHAVLRARSHPPHSVRTVRIVEYKGMNHARMSADLSRLQNYLDIDFGILQILQSGGCHLGVLYRHLVVPNRVHSVHQQAHAQVSGAGSLQWRNYGERL